MYIHALRRFNKVLMVCLIRRAAFLEGKMRPVRVPLYRRWVSIYSFRKKNHKKNIHRKLRNVDITLNLFEFKYWFSIIVIVIKLQWNFKTITSPCAGHQRLFVSRRWSHYTGKRTCTQKTMSLSLKRRSFSQGLIWKGSFDKVLYEKARNEELKISSHI